MLNSHNFENILCVLTTTEISGEFYHFGAKGKSLAKLANPLECLCFSHQYKIHSDRGETHALSLSLSSPTVSSRQVLHVMYATSISTIIVTFSRGIQGKIDFPLSSL